MTTGEFNDEELGFDVDNVNIPLVGDAVLDKVEGGPVEGQKIGDDSQGPTGDQGQGAAGQAGDFSAQDVYFISDALLNLPTVIWTKLPERDPEKIKVFNQEFHRYCVRKGVNPWDYFFEEFGLAMAVLPILVSYRTDYIELYSKPKKDKVKHGLDVDHENYMKTENEREEKKEVLEDGE